MHRVLLLSVVLGFAAPPVFAQDPVKVDPAHHQVVLENDQVRVLRIAFGPKEKAPVHEHPASVAVFLTDAHFRISPVGGKPDETPQKRGGIVAVSAGKHTVENIGGAKTELVLVELKGPAAPAPWLGVAQDAVKLDAKHYKIELENDRARVLRVTYGPKEKSVMHDHPATVAVFLTDANVTFTGAGASARPNASKAGEVVWSDAETHLPENVSDKPFETIVVELKTKK